MSAVPPPPPPPGGQFAPRNYVGELGVKAVSPLPWSPNTGRRYAPVVPPKPKKVGSAMESGEDRLSSSRDDVSSVYSLHVYETIPAMQKPVPQKSAIPKNSVPVPWSQYKPKTNPEGIKTVSFGTNLGTKAIITSSKLPSGASMDEASLSGFHKAQPVHVQDSPYSGFVPSQETHAYASPYVDHPSYQKPDLLNQSAVSFHDYESLNNSMADMPAPEDLPPPPPPEADLTVPIYTCIGEDTTSLNSFPPPPPPEELIIPSVTPKQNFNKTFGQSSLPAKPAFGGPPPYNQAMAYRPPPTMNNHANSPRPDLVNSSGSAGSQTGSQRPQPGYTPPAPGVPGQGARSISISSARHVQPNPVAVEVAKKASQVYSTAATATPPNKTAGLIASGPATEAPKRGDEVDQLTQLLVKSMTVGPDVDSSGKSTFSLAPGESCSKCRKKIVGEGGGCMAMNQVFHVMCFTCAGCDKGLDGQPFFAVDGKPHCEECYIETLEKCSVCMKPVLDRILRATGKPYHPKCFCCVVCGKCLDGIPFTVDAHNQVHCIEDFHKKFAPRCSVCKGPIMPEPGEEETVRIVALDRSFHVNCYRCEDCGMIFSSESDGKGCYPLDGHILCKNCNAKRIQALTSPRTV